MISFLTEPTQVEIDDALAKMTHADGNDVYRTIARLRHSRAEKPATIPKDPPWDITPTNDQIAAEARDKGLSFESAAEDLEKEFAADARRLASASPGAADKVAKLKSEADQLKQLADQTLADESGLLDGIESAIYRLQNVRLQIEHLRKITIDDEREHALAEQAIGFHFGRQGAGESAATASGFRNSINDLAALQCLQKFIPAHHARLEAEAAAIISEIRSIATDGKIDLRNFIALLRSESGRRPGANLSANSDLYAGIV